MESTVPKQGAIDLSATIDVIPVTDNKSHVPTCPTEMLWTGIKSCLSFFQPTFNLEQLPWHVLY